MVSESAFSGLYIVGQAPFLFMSIQGQGFRSEPPLPRPCSSRLSWSSLLRPAHMGRGSQTSSLSPPYVSYIALSSTDSLIRLLTHARTLFRIYLI